MAHDKDAVRDVVLAALAVIIAAAVVAFAGIPTRVSVLESQFGGIDKKLDQIIAHQNQ